MFNPQIASIAYKAGEISTADSMIVIMQEAIPAALGILIASLILAAISMLLKEGVGSVKEETETDREMANFRINPIMAIIPVIPLFLLVIASKQVGWLPTKTFSVPVCMLIGTALAWWSVLFISRTSAKRQSASARAPGDGFNNVVILIAAAALFAAGMKSIGLTARSLTP